MPNPGGHINAATLQHIRQPPVECVCGAVGWHAGLSGSCQQCGDTARRGQISLCHDCEAEPLRPGTRRRSDYAVDPVRVRLDVERGLQCVESWQSDQSQECSRQEQDQSRVADTKTQIRRASRPCLPPDLGTPRIRPQQDAASALPAGCEADEYPSGCESSWEYILGRPLGEFAPALAALTDFEEMILARAHPLAQV